MDALIKRFSEKFTPEQTALFQQAVDFTVKHHEGQKRESGEPYIIHPVAVAKLVLDMGMDSVSVIAAMLHDTVEDCEDVSLEDIRILFGADVTQLVDGVTKLTISGKQTYITKKQEQAENAALIAEYEAKLKSAEIVEHDLTDLSTVNIGMMVSIKGEDGKVKKYELTGATANMFDAKNPKISKDSPIGKAIIGKKKGDTVEVEAPAGTMKFTIEDISKKK